jgi:hypothetical protein
MKRTEFFCTGPNPEGTRTGRPNYRFARAGKVSKETDRGVPLVRSLNFTEQVRDRRIKI